MHLINIKVECPFFSFEQDVPETKCIVRLKQIKKLFEDMKKKFEGVEKSNWDRKHGAKLKVTTAVKNPHLF